MLGNLLVYQELKDPRLVKHLETLFDNVVYYAVDGFHPSSSPKTHPLPSAEEYAAADVLFCVTLPANLLHESQTPRLRFIQLLSSGVGHIISSPFYKSFKEDHPLQLANATGLQVTPIGEHVVAVSLMLRHKLNQLVIQAARDEAWVSNQSMGGHYVREMRGETVGILGYGALGRESARLFNAFGTRVLACTRSGVAAPLRSFQLPNTGDPLGVIPQAYYSSTDRASLLDFLAQCDVVVVTVPATPENLGLIDAEALRAMKGDAILINVGRGETVETETLIEALQGVCEDDEEEAATGTLRIGGAALDVTNPEPLPPHHMLFKLPNVIITPHSSGLSTVYCSRAVDLLEQNIDNLRAGKELVNSLR